MFSMSFVSWAVLNSFVSFVPNEKFVFPDGLIYNAPLNLFYSSSPSSLVLSYFINLTFLGVEFYAY